MNQFRYFGAITSFRDFVMYIFYSYNPFFMLLGLYWLIIEVSSFFSVRIEDFFKTNGIWGVYILILITLWLRRPIKSWSENLKNRDLTIEVVIGDIFKCTGDFIIASTTSFDTSLEDNTVSKKTLIGQFIMRYFNQNSNNVLLNQQIDNSLENEIFDPIPADWVGKKRKYRIGTVVKVRFENRNCYMVAINNKNRHGNVETHENSFDDLKIALSNTWEYVEKRGELSELIIPLMGTGSGRIKEKRIDVFKAIIDSFIASNSSCTICKKLTICIYPPDLKNFDLAEAIEYLRHECKYTETFSTRRGLGIPI